MTEPRVTRGAFVAIAAALTLKSADGEGHQREQAKRAKETAEKLADLLGLPEDDPLDRSPAARAEELERMVRMRDEQLIAAQVRIRELEDQLEQATAPAAQKGRRS